MTIQLDRVDRCRRDEITVRYDDLGGRECALAVTAWGNGDGWDVVISDGARQERVFSLGDDDYRALRAAITLLDDLRAAEVNEP